MKSATRTGPAVEEPEWQVLDMRLLPAALGCWLATIVAVTLGWFAGLLLAVGAVGLAIGLWVVLLWAMAHRRERWRVVAVTGLATIVLAAGFGAAGAWREHHVQTHPLRESFGRSVNVVAVVSDDAKPMRSSAFGGQRRWIVHAGLREFGGGATWTRVGGAIVVLAEGSEWAELSPGQVVRFRAKVSEPNRADLTIATLQANAVVERIGDPPWWQRWATSVRTDLVDAAARALPPAAAGLLPALVVGDTSALSDEVRDAFEIAGLQHLCVVSGANFTILLTALLALTRLVTAGPRTSAAAAAGAVVLFVVVARPDPSVLRAAAMGSVTVLALLTGRRKQALPALCAAVIGLLAVAPQLAVSAGFALSVIATAGLILLAPSWADWLRARGWWRAPAEIVAVAAGAFVVTLPLMVALSGRVSLVAIAANALVAPVIGLITVIGAVGAVTACLWGEAAVWVLWCARPPLWWLLGVADRAAAVPGATVSVSSGVTAGLVAAVIVVAIVAALRWSRTRRLLAVGVLGMAVVLVPVRLFQPGWPPEGWVLAMCDVGQGDGLALSVGSGAAVVIDTGPDPRLIRHCLDRLRITRISLLVLTHPHADHIAGLSGAIDGRVVDAIGTAPGELRSTVDHDCPPHPRGESQAATQPGVVPSESGEIASPSSAATTEPTVPGQPAAPRASGSLPPTGPPVSSERMAASCALSLAGDRAGSEAATHRDHHEHADDSGGVERVSALARAARIPLLELHAGHVISFGGVELTVVSPSRIVPTTLPQNEANDRSLVLKARTPIGTILFTGDIEAGAQTSLLRNHDVRADILKVPHHGSRTTTPEFLRAVHPRLALISAGADNAFGHPHSTITATLTELGATIARTDRDGDTIVLGDPANLRTVTTRRRTTTGRALRTAVRGPT
ncbi:ComEC/Rec2 family competence protein [Nocardia mangyaensis]|uniref:ComEC/Rec2 family competence protein n=1 Tax=Nocardia mangyaensis TaxID=2213200 RepID=UPI002674F280|nr:ComEC/Rec2 family competence protein [Nocardia mangyaensis]MDO3649610.1 ComEC/Rec2 family competence protein [Nocardia mangyaensis]